MDQKYITLYEYISKHNNDFNLYSWFGGETIKEIKNLSDFETEVTKPGRINFLFVDKNNVLNNFTDLNNIPDVCVLSKNQNNVFKIFCNDNLPIFIDKFLYDYYITGKNDIELDIASKDIRDMNFIDLYKQNDIFISSTLPDSASRIYKNENLFFFYFGKNGILAFNINRMTIIVNDRSYLYVSKNDKKYIIVSDEENKFLKLKDTYKNDIIPKSECVNFITSANFKYSNTNYNIHNSISSKFSHGQQKNNEFFPFFESEIVSINETKTGFKEFKIYNKKGSDPYDVGYDIRMFGVFTTTYRDDIQDNNFVICLKDSKNANVYTRIAFPEELSARKISSSVTLEYPNEKTLQFKIVKLNNIPKREFGLIKMETYIMLI